MTFDIRGWVEVDRTAGDYLWVPFLNISSVIDVSDQFSESVFGHSKNSVTENRIGLFKNNGMPINPSNLVLTDYGKNINANNADGLTYVYWNEIENHLNLTSDSEWFIVKVCIDQLIKKTNGLNSHFFRIIAWYNW